ncbi:hypothetical protein TCDM_03248 [Trypanosoma cruzi Dm28c]|uniref:Uncharacterized protein n=2 Tax=Trypanosoma cruzi TaxID=5693 RepID=V5B414_TRYCR|nr:hypothetical protein TCDM_03248 [Trypanosoma cruzi Dm28c]
MHRLNFPLSHIDYLPLLSCCFLFCSCSMPLCIPPAARAHVASALVLLCIVPWAVGKRKEAPKSTWPDALSVRVCLFFFRWWEAGRDKEGGSQPPRMVRHVGEGSRRKSRKRQREDSCDNSTHDKKARSHGNESGPSPSCIASFHTNEESMPLHSSTREEFDSLGHVTTPSTLPHKMDVETVGLTDKNEGGSFFIIHLNERPSRVAVATPYINPRQLFGHAGILLQDVTVPRHPILLLPCPHTGNVTVHPRRRYRLMKFIGEHMCLAGDFYPVLDEEYQQRRQNSSEAFRIRQRESWAMSELMGMMKFLQSNPQNSVDDFWTLPPEEAARYHSHGNVALLERSEGIQSENNDEMESVSDGELGGASSSNGDT